MHRVIYASSNKNSDAYYAVRIEIPDPFFYVDTGAKQYVFLDHREFGVFQEKNKNPAIELVLVNPLTQEAAQVADKTSGANRLAWTILQKYGLASDPIEVPTSFPLDMADYLRSKGCKITPIQPFFTARLKKTAIEVGAIRDALKRTQKTFVYIEQVLKQSTVRDGVLRYQDKILTSESLKAEVEQILLAEDLVSPEGLIVSCGPHAAIPHHPGSGPLRAGETVVCDIFPKHRANGYFADMTRTYVKGEPSPRVRDMYEAVRAAQEAAEQAVRSGVTGASIHKICVDLLLARGFDVGDKGFTHGTGHGLGLDIHEPPYLNSTSKEILEEGHVVTIEPGLYYPELGGVRIEDVVVVTKDGCENLTQYHKEYLMLP